MKPLNHKLIRRIAQIKKSYLNLKCPKLGFKFHTDYRDKDILNQKKRKIGSNFDLIKIYLLICLKLSNFGM